MVSILSIISLKSLLQLSDRVIRRLNKSNKWREILCIPPGYYSLSNENTLRKIKLKGEI
jgi:hypothetical protein